MAAAGEGPGAQTANVRVVCRLRPMSDREKRTGTVPAAMASTERKEVVVSRKNQAGRQSKMTFKFDEVLSTFSTQEDVFNATLQPLVGQVLAGYEATAFAYGQTGTGKTYTMEGIACSEDTRGLMPRAAAAVLDALAKGKYADYHVSVSYLEIYNEELTDLLAPVGNQPKLDLLEAGGNRGVCCVGLSEVPVSSLDDIGRLVCAAQERRRVAETRINARSSRSHCIFTMKVLCRRTCSGGEQETVGKLHLVDLAGSECAKKASMPADEVTTPTASAQKPIQSQSQAAAFTLEQERERKNINQSLLTLRRVIAALREKSARVPYRDSKLTRLLQSALGGSCRTVVIATISPALAVVEETISTLSYAEQAAGIQNRPVAISSLRWATSSGSMMESVGEITPAGGGGEWSADFEMRMAYMAQEVEEAQVALARKHQEVQELTDRAEAAEQELEEAREDLARVRAQLAESESERQRMATAACNLAGDLESSMAGSLTAMREGVVDLASKLGKEDAAASERRVAELLATQKAALQAENTEVRSALDRARTELSAARAETAELRAAQARSREAALEAIVAAARRELEAVGQQLEAGSQGLAARLEKTEACADSIGDSAVSAEARVLAAGADVGRAAQAWAKDVATGCEAMGRASEEASASAERGVADIAQRLRGIGVGKGDGSCPARAEDGEENGDAQVAEHQSWDPQNAKENNNTIAVEAAEVAAAAAVAATKGNRSARGAPARPLREVN